MHIFCFDNIFVLVYHKNMETKRLLLRKLRKSDAYDIYRNIFHDKKVLQTFLGRYAATFDTFDFDGMLDFFEKKLFCYGIELKENHECIGIIFENERHDETIEIGYALSSAYWNLGYMSEALAAVLKELMEEEKGYVFSAAAFKENVGSWRVMEKCGMKYSHTVKDEIEWQGKSHDVVYYEIKKGDK